MKIKLIKEVGTHSVGTILEINDGYGRQLIEQEIAEGVVKDPVTPETVQPDQNSTEVKEVKDPVTTKEVKEVPQTKEKK